MRRKVGAEFLKNRNCNFTVWAPAAEKVEIIFKEKKEPISLESGQNSYWDKIIPEVSPGALYKIRLNQNKELPDPASRSQPDGVHSWSEVIDNDFSWQDENWSGLPASEMIVYELHVGTFSPEGTFEAIISKLDHLKELGVNTIEIMPVAQVPGSRNWGYDGVYPYATQSSYGGADGLKKLVEACHQNGIAVILDVVYNHLGPEGNYMAEFGPYFTEKYKTPWGKAINFDDKNSDEVRNFFLQNALMWLSEFRIDGLRLDAIHEIIDRGARHFLKELSEAVDELEENSGRNKVLIAESDLNDTRIIDSYQKGGYGLEAQWVDDFHHSLHTLLTEEKEGYYQDFGSLRHLAKSFEQAFVYDGVYSSFRQRTVGNSPRGMSPSKFVICIQNHDQVGNRMLGERLSKLVSFEQVKLAAGILLMAPFVPMLFMGEEFGEDQPFQYFVSHGDPDLVKAVQEGRKREFEYFFREGKSEDEFPDPQSEDTFRNSMLNWDFEENDQKKILFQYYKQLIALRKKGTFKTFGSDKADFKIDEDRGLLKVSGEGKKSVFVVFNFSKKEQDLALPQKNKELKVVFSSADKKWGGATESNKSYAASEKIKLSASSVLLMEN